MSYPTQMDEVNSQKPLWDPSRLKRKFFHTLFLLTRPMTIEVRALVFNRGDERIVLVRNTHLPGWHLPGGGVEPGEAMRGALERHLLRECNIRITGESKLVSLHHNRRHSRRDHVAFYVVTAFEQEKPKSRGRGIADSGFFAINALPETTTPATRRRLVEFCGIEPISQYW